jgi:hypothetical protein
MQPASFAALAGTYESVAGSNRAPAPTPLAGAVLVQPAQAQTATPMQQRERVVLRQNNFLAASAAAAASARASHGAAQAAQAADEAQFIHGHAYQRAHSASRVQPQSSPSATVPGNSPAYAPAPGASPTAAPKLVVVKRNA